MSEGWRELLYPLGFLSSLAFGGRFLLQWLTSEIKGKSVVTETFWKLSLVGNVLLLAHSLIQMQYHVALVQTCNGFVSWRNMNLMGDISQQISFKRALVVLSLLLVTVSCIFLLQAFFFSDSGLDLFRIPVTPWRLHSSGKIPFFWHMLGAAGLLLFNSRFWVQWWSAEKSRKSYLGPAFWWISLIGDSLCLAYFFRLGDPVNLVGPLLGVIPYIRNLMLLREAKKMTPFERP